LGWFPNGDIPSLIPDNLEMGTNVIFLKIMNTNDVDNDVVDTINPFFWWHRFMEIGFWFHHAFDCVEEYNEKIQLSIQQAIDWTRKEEWYHM